MWTRPSKRSASLVRFVEKRCLYENAGNGTAEPGETDDDEDLEREGLPVG